MVQVISFKLQLFFFKKLYKVIIFFIECCEEFFSLVEIGKKKCYNYNFVESLTNIKEILALKLGKY